MNEINQGILSLLSSKPFQKLTAYYKQTTLFNVIGTERSENRHSAFLRWLLSPDSSHGLGTEPMKLFLRLIATLEMGEQTFGDALYRKVLAGNYELELLEPVDVEKNVGKLSVQDDRNYEKTSKDRLKELDETGKDMDLLLLQELWDANEDVFKAVAFQKYSEKKEDLGRLFKGSNRDTTKFRVCYGKDNKEVFSGKRLSKAMAACAIFKAYLALHPTTTLEQLREAFPCKSINAYYWNNYYADLFYPYLPDQVDENGEQCLEYTAEKRKGRSSCASWDFFMKEDQFLPLANGTQKAMCVKMWRRADFDRMIALLQEKNEQITVEECL